MVSKPDFCQSLLDEFYEYGTKNLEALRQPLEDRVITISRAQRAVRFPANFILVIAGCRGMSPLANPIAAAP